MNKIKKYIQFMSLSAFAVGIVSIASPLTGGVVSAKCDGGDSRILSFPKWQNGLPGTCKKPEIQQLNDFWIIVLNGVEILLQLVAYVAAGFVVWGGFKYIKSEGEPAKITEARAAIMNGVIGLAIALSSVALVAYVQGAILQ